MCVTKSHYLLFKRIFASGATERNDQDCGQRSEFRETYSRAVEWKRLCEREVKECLSNKVFVKKVSHGDLNV